jgi:tryptophan synthase alpha subunit
MISRPYKNFQKNSEKLFVKIFDHTHTTIILHLMTYCNTFFEKTVDNFSNFF